MRISAVVPMRNEQRLVQGAIESLQNAGVDEIVVVDGGSDDRSVAVAEKTGAKVVLSKRGRGTQLNFGVRQTDGDVLLFLHADCRLGQTAIVQLRQSFDGRYVFGAFRQSIQAAGIVYRLIETGNAARVRWRRMPYGDQAMFVRRSAFEDCDGFPDFPLMEDVVLSRRLARLSAPCLLPGPVFVDARRWQQAGPVRQTLKNWGTYARFCCGKSPQVLAQLYEATNSTKVGNSRE